jgi:hypothetical protein
MHGPGLLQDQFPGVSTPEYFSPASKNTLYSDPFQHDGYCRPKYFNRYVTLVKYITSKITEGEERTN